MLSKGSFLELIYVLLFIWSKLSLNITICFTRICAKFSILCVICVMARLNTWINHKQMTTHYCFPKMFLLIVIYELSQLVYFFTTLLSFSKLMNRFPIRVYCSLAQNLWQISGKHANTLTKAYLKILYVFPLRADSLSLSVVFTKLLIHAINSKL